MRHLAVVRFFLLAFWAVAGNSQPSETIAGSDQAELPKSGARALVNGATKLRKPDRRQCSSHLAEDAAHFTYFAWIALELGSLATSKPEDLKDVLTLIENRKDDKALVNARIAVKRSPQSAVLMSCLGIALAMVQNYDLAEQALFRAAELAEFVLQPVDIDKESKSFLSRIAAAEIAQQLQSLRAHIFYMLGRVQWQMGLWDLAIESLAATVANDPTVPEAWEWLARAHDRSGHVPAFLDAWKEGLLIDPMATDKYVWPVYCVGMAISEDKSSRLVPLVDSRLAAEDPRRKHRAPSRHPVAKLLTEERTFVLSLIEGNHGDETVGTDDATSTFLSLVDQPAHVVPPALAVFVADLRTMECSADFITRRNAMIVGWLKEHTSYTWTNFAYGQVYFQGWWNAFSRPTMRAAMEATRRMGMDFVALGSNVGTETLYAAMGFGVNAVGYDLMCPFVRIAEEMRKRHGVDNARFLCEDALKADLGNAGVVFIDNQAWDGELMKSMWVNLAAYLPDGALVFEYTGADYHSALQGTADASWQLVQCDTLDVSWYPLRGTHAAVFRKRESRFTGEYLDWFDYRGQLSQAWFALEQMRLSEDLEAAGSEAHEKLLQVPWDRVDRLQAILTRGGAGAGLSAGLAAHVTSRALSNEVMELFHRVLFDWHCRRFGMLSGHDYAFLPEEVAYIETFFRLSGNEHRNFALLGNWTGNRMSSFSYSHRVRGHHRVDSARFRLGTTSQFDVFRAAAEPLLRARSIQEPLRLVDQFPSSIRFYGLGWDLSKRHFKVYLMISDLLSLPKRYRDLLHAPYNSKQESNDIWSTVTLLPHALLAFTYDLSKEGVGDAQLYEEKVYVYPRTLQDTTRLGVALADPYFISTAAVMFSSRRGQVTQFDIDAKWGCIWRRQLSKVGRRIVDTYMDVGMTLETLAVKNRTDFTLYFPSGSG